MPTLVPRWACVSASLLFLAPPAFAAGPKVPEGFEARLIAEVPAVEFPCQVATAPDGTLFVAEDPMDQRGPYEAYDGRILRFVEGQDPTRFAEGFRAIQGMAWHEGALLVCHMPYLTVVRDIDGDGIADAKHHLFTDLGPTDNQGLNDHIVSGTQLGMDGWLYISVGDKGVPGATRREDGVKVQLKGGGTLRCRPDGTELEVFSSGTRNHLEANLDAADHLFTYDNTDDGDGWWTRVTHHIYHGYYGYAYDYHDHPERFLPRMAEYGGGSPCGAVFYREDAWPERYRGIGLWAEWGKGKVQAFRFEPDGATFKVAESIDFAVPDGTRDFRPIDLALSYDGKTLYIADWNMGGWNNKTEKVGRVWAITYTGRATAAPRGHDTLPLGEQVKLLSHPSYNERMRAQHALVRAGESALSTITAALDGPEVPALAKRHLIWALDGLAGGTPGASLPLIEQLGSPHADVRAQAARALGERRATIAVDHLVALLNDPEPSVRLQAITALNRLGEPRTAEALVPHLTEPDQFLAFATRKALREIGNWEALASALGTDDPERRIRILLTCEQVHDLGAVSILAEFAAGSGLPEERARAITYLAEVHRKAKPWDGRWWGTRPTRGSPPARTVDWEGTAVVSKSIRGRLEDQAPVVRRAAVRAVVTIDDRGSLAVLRKGLETDPDREVRTTIAGALGDLSDTESLPMLIAVLRAADAPESVREAALGAVEKIGGAQAITAMIAVLDSGTLPADRQARVMEALGRSRAENAVPSLIAGLNAADPIVRAAALGALARIGPRDGALEAVRPLLLDADLAVRKSAIAALGALKDREAVPGLIAASSQDSTRFEATRALAEIADLRALPVLLRGLIDINTDLRKECATAIGSIRDEAAPVLDRLAERNELSPRVVTELRKVYAAVEPIRLWRALGPFARKSDAPLPFDLDGPIDLNAKYPGAGDALVAWRLAQASGDHGRVDLDRLFGSDTRDAFAYAEVHSTTARQAEMVVGSDDTLTVWVNGKQVYDFQRDRSFAPDQARFPVDLVEGMNRVVARCGNTGGGWTFAAALTTATDHPFLKATPESAFDPEAFREFAASSRGDAARGRALFSDLKGLACAKCHAVAGQGGDVGPDLSSVASLYGRDELVNSVLYPSSRIFSGYEPVVIATTDGRVLTGVLKSDTAEAVEIQDADANRVRVPMSEIEERKTSDVSLMPSGLAEGLKPEDFADLIAYLETLKAVPKPVPEH